MKCFSCPQPWHPSTGHYDRQWDICVCETCYKAFLFWMKGHVVRQWSGHAFYVEAETSVRPGMKSPDSFTPYHRLQGPMQETKRRKPNPAVVQVVPVTNEPENISRVSTLWVAD